MIKNNKNMNNYEILEPNTSVEPQISSQAFPFQLSRLQSILKSPFLVFNSCAFLNLIFPHLNKRR